MVVDDETIRIDRKNRIDKVPNALYFDEDLFTVTKHLHLALLNSSEDCERA